MTEHSCLLRRLTLCDGHEVVTLARGLTDECYCVLIASEDARAAHLPAAIGRTARARAVARAEQLQRIREQRDRLDELVARLEREW